MVEPTPSRRPRRSYTRDFKIDAVGQCECGDRSLAQVAMDLKVNANLLRRWQRELQSDSGKANLLPVQVSQSGPPPQDGYIELSVNDISIKVIGVVEHSLVANLIRSLR